MHHPQPLGVDEVAGGVQQRYVQGDEIRHAQHVLDALRAPDLRRQAPCRVDRNRRVEADDVHAELDRRLGNVGTDGAQADHAQRAARQLHAGELLLARLGRLVHFFIRAGQAFDELQRRHQVARAEQHAGDHQFLHCVGVGTGRVEHRHAAFRQLLHRDVVGPRAGTRDRAHRGGDVHLVHVGRAHQDAVRIGHIAADRIGLRQPRQSARGNGIEREDLARLSHGFSRIRAGSRPAHARPRSAWRCRSRRACRRPSGGPSAGSGHVPWRP